MTDFDRDDALDRLTPEQLEEQAFGPTPKEPPSLRGLIRRPAEVLAARPEPSARRSGWRLMLAGAACALVGAGLTFAVVAGPFGADDPVVEYVETPVDAPSFVEFDVVEEPVLMGEVEEIEEPVWMGEIEEVEEPILLDDVEEVEEVETPISMG